MTAKKPIPNRDMLTGKTGKQIALEFGISLTTAYNWLYLANVPRLPTGRNAKPIPPKEELDQLSYAEIIAKYHVCISTVHNWRRILGLTSKRRPRKNLKALRLMESKIAKVKMRNDKIIKCLSVLNDSEIARAFDISREYVGQIRAVYTAKGVEK